MNARLMLVEIRKVWAWYLAFLLVTVSYLVLKPYPLAHNDIAMAVLAAFQGALLGWRIFHDPAGTQSFIWSRPLTRAQLFLNRWLLGLSLQVLTLVVVLALVGSGARSLFHETLSEETNPFYPASRWFDLAVLWPCAVYGLLAYQAALYLNAFAEFNWRHLGGAISGTLRRTLLSIMAVCFPAAVFVLVDLPPSTAPRWPYGILVAGIAVITVATTVMTVHVYRHMEVES
jgi:hypothetical protein